VIPSDYGVTIGKLHGCKQSLSLAACGCGLLMLTTPQGRGYAAECASCLERHEAEPGARRSEVYAPRGRRSDALALLVLVALAVVWVTSTGSAAPQESAEVGR
jgi:hypothetical protein